MAIRHVQHNLSYTDVRHFKLPSASGAESDCALIRHYLGNSHVVDLVTPSEDIAFAIKMLARLAAHNFSVGRVELQDYTHRLTDYGSMNVVFGKMQMNELDLSCEEPRLVELVKTTDFFRMSAVQRLRKLKLSLVRFFQSLALFASVKCQPWDDEEDEGDSDEEDANDEEDEEEKPKGHARSNSPLWISGIYSMPNCEHYRVDYDTDLTCDGSNARWHTYVRYVRRRNS